jgi:hypothetical protein
VIRRRFGCIAAPPGPRYKFRDRMFTGVVHKTGTPCGSFFVFFWFASATDNGNNNDATATAINFRYGFLLSILNTPLKAGFADHSHLDWGKTPRG